MRFIFIIMAVIISKYGNYYQPRECAQVQFIVHDDAQFTKLYPQCTSSASPLAPGVTLVHANISSDRSEEVAAALGVSFGAGAWLGLIIHAFLVELYVCPT